MQRIYGLILGTLLLPALAQAADAVGDKHRGFLDSKQKLDTKLTEFLSLVNACNPPFKARILDGFGDKPGGPNNLPPPGARAALQIHERDVGKHVAAAEEKFKSLREEWKTCKNPKELLARASEVGKEAQTNLNSELGLYKTGVEEGQKSRGDLMTALNTRRLVWERTGKLVSSEAPEQVQKCDAAIKKVDELEASNAELLSKLVELHNSYPDRLTLETVALSAPQSCGLPVQKASFKPEFQDEPARDKAEGDSGTAI